ncbi:MAG: hypothetical protein BMS9Abin23_0577 [Thermodesulfobacteriota bacterium]|nr:MAG: hypothetical protein BMS9Abin23_0577 [Thermodesulfobacteriota bacterium]
MVKDEYHKLIEDVETCLLYMGGVGLGEVYSKKPVIEEIEKSVEGCRRCPLHKLQAGRFFGRGGARPRVVFVGSSPPAVEKGGVDPDPFRGEEGMLLEKIIKALEFEDKDCYLTYAVKCAVTPGEADLEEGVRACSGFLREQIKALEPEAVIALGPIASIALTGGPDVESLRGKVLDYNSMELIVTYGTAELLADKGLKKYAWSDIKMLLRALKG